MSVAVFSETDSAVGVGSEPLQIGRVGPELELLLTKNGELVEDPTEFLPNGGDLGELGCITVDAGRGWAEYVPGPCDSASELERAICALDAQVPADLERHFIPRNFLLANVEPEERWNNKRRYTVLRDALAIDSPKGWTHVHEMTLWGATQFTLDVDPFSVPGLALVNYWNNIAPFISYVVAHYIGYDEMNRGHHLAWTRFANPRRLPGPWWHESVPEYRAFFTGLRRLLTRTRIEGCSEEESKWEWSVDMQAFQMVGDPPSEGTFWHFARPKKQYKNSANGCPGCVELRPFPTVCPSDIGWLGPMVVDISNTFLREIHGMDVEDLRSPRTLRSVYSNVATERSFRGFVPWEPIEKEDWWEFFRQ